jgi:hypothetical protein
LQGMSLHTGPIETARIPELPSTAVFRDLELDDEMPVYLTAENKTARATFQEIYTLVQTGGAGSIPAVIRGGIVIRDVSLLEDGGTTFLVPELAGKTFNLKREGRPLLPSEYEVLNAGGFKLLIPGDVLLAGQRFELDPFETASTTGGGGSTSTTSLFTGVVTVSTAATFNPTTDLNKVIQFRGGAFGFTYTLPLIEELPPNQIILLEALINNAGEVSVQTGGGQFLYFNNEGFNTPIGLRGGDSLWLLRGTDGWYVINDFGRIYNEIGSIQSRYKAGLNELVCKGQLLNRSEYPRLWAWVQTLGTSLVTDTLWNTASVVNAGRTYPTPYIGCFSSGDGSTTFRLPNLMNTFLRGVKSESGTDIERLLNKPGGFQENKNKSHDHPRNPEGAAEHYMKVNEPGGSLGIPGGSKHPANALKTGLSGGVESVPDNVGVLWTIKC